MNRITQWQHGCLIQQRSGETCLGDYVCSVMRRTSNTCAWSMFNANSHHHDHHPKRCRNIHTHKLVCYTIFGCCICSSFPNLLQKSTFVNFWLNVDQLIEITYFEKKGHSPFFRGEHYCSVTFGSRFPRFRRLKKKMFF